MSVACFRIHRNREDLLWIIGSSWRYGPNGTVPVGTTQSSKFDFQQLLSFESMPAMRAVVGLASLFHDIGKTNHEFQHMLETTTQGNRVSDSYRHEWLSALMFATFVKKCGSDDASWIASLQKSSSFQLIFPKDMEALGNHPFQGLPFVATIITWLILSHHRLPYFPGIHPAKGANELMDAIHMLDEHHLDFVSIMGMIQSSWSYQKEETASLRHLTFNLSNLEESAEYVQTVHRDAEKLEEAFSLLKKLPSSSIRLFLLYSRTALMLGDYNFSSQKPLKEEQPSDTDCNTTYANLRLYVDKAGNEHQVMHQTVVEHLLGVRSLALQSLSMLRFANAGARMADKKSIRKSSKGKYCWQDLVSKAFRNACEEEARDHGLRPASFILDMASTGMGKTLGNAKIMRSLSDDFSLRYSVLFGLRTLTLQTGDAYQEKLKLEEDDYTVLIGNRTVQELHEQEHLEELRQEDASKWEEELLSNLQMKYPAWLDMDLFDNTVDGNLEDSSNGIEEKRATSSDDDSLISVLFHGNPERIRMSRAMMEVPILVSTIDHMMGATECIVGGSYMLPLLRMMSSDLIIDEIDDFSPNDLLAISRLVHLAGMFGRNVITSSATMPPGLVEGMLKAFLQGYQVYQSFFGTSRRCHIGWCDEFHHHSWMVSPNYATGDYLEKAMQEHRAFVKKRVKALLNQPVRRKGATYLVPQETLHSPDPLKSYFQCYFNAAMQLHETNYNIDKATGKRYSIGAIRVAHINFCVALSKFFLKKELPPDVELRILPYHSRQTLILRHIEEAYLDTVLKRPFAEGETTDKVTDTLMRHILESSFANDVIFILIATPVEEIGRDHDFDWGVIEPSSERSLIQFAGRILRHRDVFALTQPNVLVMQYNLAAFLDLIGVKPAKAVFCNPGPETVGRWNVKEHLFARELRDTTKLLPQSALDCIDSIPRIQQNPVLNEKESLVDLEHVVANEFAEGGAFAVDTISGWTRPDSFLFTIGVAQAYGVHAFRQGYPQFDVWLRHNPGECSYQLAPFLKEKKDKQPSKYKKSCLWHKHDPNRKLTEAIMEKETFDPERLWIFRSYQDAIKEIIEKKLAESGEQTEPTDEDYFKAERKFGVLTVYSSTKPFHYSDNLGLYTDL